MPDPEINKFSRVEELFDAGKLDDSLEILNDHNQLEALNSQEKDYYQFLKGLIYIYQNKNEEAIDLGDQIYREGQELNRPLQSFDGLFLMLTGLGLSNKWDEASNLIEKAEALMEHISNFSNDIVFKCKIRLRVLKAWINLYVGNTDLAEKCLEWISNSQKQVGNIFEIVWANMLVSQIMLQVKHRYDLAIEYAKKAKSIAKSIKFNHYWLGFCDIALGVMYYAIGELDISFKYHLKSLTIFKEINNIWYISAIYNNLGGLYCGKGEYRLALEYFEECLLLRKKTSESNYGIYGGFAGIFGGLIEVALEMGDIELAQQYFHHLENLSIQKKDKNTEIIYKYEKALILKRSNRIRDKAMAEEILKQIVETKTIFFDLIRDALIHLCDLLLSEYHINKSADVIHELNTYISRLLTIAEESHSYLIFCEVFILQAKLALLDFDLNAARRFLIQAQKIAESYGIKRLAIKISHEHDNLIKQIKFWENLKESNASLSERWELAGLNKQLENMVKKKGIEAQELVDEEPVFLLIVSEGGVPYFSYSFITDKEFEDHLLGGFFTAINSFIH
ncbi:MAG: tetratricopeptide repeat protein, partial [Candidatus Thorarchaeota archaeon]